MRSPAVTDRRRAGRSLAEPNLTPMIDVVFLLIVFFLVSSHLARRETRERVDLPTAATAQADRDPRPRLMIHVTADGAVRVASATVAPADLIERLRSIAERGDAPRVRLRTDRAAPYAAVEPVLAACAEAGLEDVALAVVGTTSDRATPSRGDDR